MGGVGAWFERAAFIEVGSGLGETVYRLTRPEAVKLRLQLDEAIAELDQHELALRLGKQQLEEFPRG